MKLLIFLFLIPSNIFAASATGDYTWSFLEGNCSGGNVILRSTDNTHWLCSNQETPLAVTGSIVASTVGVDASLVGGNSLNIGVTTLSVINGGVGIRQSLPKSVSEDNGGILHTGNLTMLQDVITNEPNVSRNHFYDGAHRRLKSGTVQNINMVGNQGINFVVSPDGAANSLIPQFDGFDRKMRIDMTGNVGVGMEADRPGTRFWVENGSVTITGTQAALIDRGPAYFGITPDISTFSASGGLTLNRGENLTAYSSITASAFFGDGSHLTGITGETNTFTSSKTFTSSVTVANQLNADTFRAGNSVAFSSTPVGHFGGFNSTLGTGTTFFAMTPDAAITLRRITVTIVVPGIGGSGDTWKCGTGARRLSVTTSAGQAAGTRSTTSGSVAVGYQTEVSGWLDATAATTPTANVVCEYVIQ